MNRHARNRFAAALAILALSLVAARPTGAEVAWRQWNAGLTEARKSGKPLLVDVYTDWCGWCKRMDRDVYSTPEIRDYLSRRFVTVKLDAEASDRVAPLGGGTVRRERLECQAGSRRHGNEPDL